MASRDRILGRLRAKQEPFEHVEGRPNTYLPVTPLTEAERSDLVGRFTAELERLTGKVHLAADAQDAARLVISILDQYGPLDTVLAWEALPLPELMTALAGRGIKVAIPRIRGEDRSDVLTSSETVRAGITGADAALATTGTLVLKSGSGQGRLPSLLPPVHIALLKRDRIFPRMEDWIAAEGHNALTTNAAVVFVTGPSRSGDIEMQSIIGMHGPGKVHVVIY